MKERIFIIFLIFFSFNVSIAQKNNDTITNILLNKLFVDYQTGNAPKRKLLSFKSKSVLYKVNPVTYLLSGGLYFYQNVLSEQIQAKCAYQISCSEFTKRSIQRYGFVKGFLTGINQLSSCFSGASDEHCRYLISTNFKIINSIEE